MKFCLLVTFMVLFVSVAQADVPLLRDRSANVGTSSTSLLLATTQRTYLIIENVCSQNVGISIDGTAAAIGSPGTVTLFPGGSMEFIGARVPQNAFNAISASGTCAVTALEVL